MGAELRAREACDPLFLVEELNRAPFGSIYFFRGTVKYLVPLLYSQLLWASGACDPHFLVEELKRAPLGIIYFFRGTFM